MNKILLLLATNVLISCMAFSQTQIIRGTVTDEWHGHPLAGATVSIDLGEDTEMLGTVTDSLGRYRIEEVPLGRQQLTVHYLGYESVLIAELPIEAGKEFIQNIQLQEMTASLSEVVVRAKSDNQIPYPLSHYTLKVEEQFRYPTTYYDPARLAMSLPGVTGTNDQGNSISVRGNAPTNLRWRLEGMDIVNPNHTANAGTFSDRPTAAGGGVNILSAQLLGTSNFLTGAFPAGYGNALGGMMDMWFRNGNDEAHEFTAQASVIGLEAAAEGPLGNQTNTSKRATYLLNYRYSFVGLLTAAGADFGGEAISFQDLSFHLNFPILKNAELGFFGMGGLSKNIFSSPLEAEEISEEKDLFDIAFRSKMGATGLTFSSPIGSKIKLQLSAAHSGLKHDRTADLVFNTPSPSLWSDDDIKEQKTVFNGKLRYKQSARFIWEAGIQSAYEKAGFQTFFSDLTGSFAYGGEVNGWLLQPYLNTYTILSPNVKLTAGLHAHYFSQVPNQSFVAPRVAINYMLSQQHQLSFGLGWYAQQQSSQTYLSNHSNKEGIGPTKSQQITAAYQYRSRKGLLFKTEIYHQQLYDVPISGQPDNTYSVLNNIETYRPLSDTLATNGEGRNYGIDFLFEQPILKTYFIRVGSSLYRSLYTAQDGRERPTQFDGKYLINGTIGREQVKKRSNKTVVRGMSARISWFGGYRQSPIDLERSAVVGRTIFDEANANSVQLKDYFRLDYRIYWTWNKPNRSTTFSIDIQNVTNRKNEAYRYYDSFLERVTIREQLGLIPLMTYRVSF